MLAIGLSLSQTSLGATPVSGIYARAFGGVALIPGNVNTSTYTNSKYRTGFDAGALLGYKSGPVHYGLEGTYIKANTNKFNFNGTTQVTTSGSSQATVAMLVLGYDFEDVVNSLSPYIDVGIGYGHIKTTLNSTSPNNTNFSGSDNLFAYQGRLGLTYNFAENAALDIAYRYVRTSKSDNTFNSVYQAHLGNIGIIYRFNSL